MTRCCAGGWDIRPRLRMRAEPLPRWDNFADSLDPAQDEVPGRCVDEVDVAASEAAGQEDAVGALDEVGELLLGDAAADDAVVRLVALADPSPIERPVDEIGAE